MKSFPYTFIAHVDKGKLIPNDPMALNVFLSGAKNGRVAVTIDSIKKQKSNSQNKYYRGVVIPIIADYMGYPSWEHDIVHGIIAAKYFIAEDSKGMKYVRSSSLDKWTTEDWEEVMHRIKYDFANMGCYIPDPDENNNSVFGDKGEV
jgi:hypothetical protein